MGSQYKNAMALFAAILFVNWCDSAQAQIGRSVPSAAYFATMDLFYGGEYRDALGAFLAEGRGAIKTTTARWIDSICYNTMAGECYYHLGDMNKALDCYTAALKIYVAYSDWMVRLQVQPIRPASSASRVPWGTSTRRAMQGICPKTMLIGQGQIDQSGLAAQGGGVVQTAQLMSIRVDEIVRCTVLAIRRRTALLGPVSRYDPLSNEVLAALMRRPVPPNTWLDAWIDLPLGLAMIAAGKETQAQPMLERSLLAGGQYDHPLTSTGLLTLGELALGRGDFDAATKFFAEASYSAAYYYDPGVLEEAFHDGVLCHLISNQKGFCPALLPGIEWSRHEGLAQLQASLLLLAAENYVAMNRPQEATRALADAKRVIGRRTMLYGRVGARLNYLTAAVLYQNRRINDADATLTAAMNFMQTGSHWLFHISLVEQGYAKGILTSRQAAELYPTVLRDPQAMDWSVDPMGALAVLLTPHVPAFEHWFEATIDRKDLNAALEVGERLRRHRFFSTLPMGGRLLSLRWLLGAPEEMLASDAQLNRLDLLAHYPAWEKLADQSRQIRSRLVEQLLAIQATSDSRRTQSQLFSQLASISLQQEGMLREMAVRREAATMIFPPLYSTAAIQKSLPQGHALLAFVCTSRNLYGFLFNSQRSTYWVVSSPALLYKKMVDLLHEWGLYEQNRELTVKELASEHWKTTASEVLQILTQGSQVDLSQKFDELIIVPDGALWYLPFEALQVEIKKQPYSLLSRVRIRYVPTASLAVPDARGRMPSGATGIVVGPLVGRDSEAITRDTSEQLTHVLPGAQVLPAPLPASSYLYSTLFNRMIVLSGITPSEQGPYAWAPIPIDRGKSGSMLGDWMAMPWDRPQELVFAGFHTPAENAMKRVDPAGAGNEMFLSICGLMASGARTILLSRWVTGGQTSCDLAREFVQELPHTFPTDAWQRSVLLSADTPIHFETEPRVKHGSNDQPPKAAHPFFWASYMLIDSAGRGKSEHAPAEAQSVREPRGK